MPRLERFSPQLVIVSAGFDAHAEDLQSYADMREEDYRWVTREIAHLADRHAGGRIVSVLEGGYDPSSLGRSAAEHIRVLARL
jgi:acetoin utilization deacetylase AcuC-like enzyme